MRISDWSSDVCSSDLIDLDVYLPLFEDESISDAGKRKLLEALWSIIISFAQLGWGVHPVQQARVLNGDDKTACGQSARRLAAPPISRDFMIESAGSLLIDHIECASDKETREG